MHGLGNDYIYIDCTATPPPENIKDLAIEMSRRHTSIGSDGIILITASDTCDFGMRIFNADGSEAKMCGNGARCVGKYVFDHGLTNKKSITLETLSGVRTLTLNVSDYDKKVNEVTVDMGKPELRPKFTPALSDDNLLIDKPISTTLGNIHITAVSMGNPHGVIFLDDDIDDIDIQTIGPELECHPLWPDRANIEFINIVNPDTIRMRVWERGSGETMACGTGACASAVAFLLKTNRMNSFNKPITVMLKGGNLKIAVNQINGHILMTGPATESFRGTYDYVQDK